MNLDVSFSCAKFEYQRKFNNRIQREKKPTFCYKGDDMHSMLTDTVKCTNIDKTWSIEFA